MERFTYNSPEHRLQKGHIVLTREIFARENFELLAHELIAKTLTEKHIPLPYEHYHNATTALFEEMTAAGDLSHLVFEGDQDEVHEATLNRLINGYHQPVPEWDKRRRFAEIVEELQVNELRKAIEAGVLPAGTMLATLSDFPDDAPSLEDAHRMGYRARNQKGMVRVYKFAKREDGTYAREIEQISRSSSLNGSTREWYNRNTYAVPLHSTGALYETVIATPARWPDGVVSYMQELDALTAHTRYGEDVSEADRQGRPIYEKLRVVSEDRRRAFQAHAKELAAYDEQLEEKQRRGDISYDERLNLFYERQSAILDRILIIDYTYAIDARGEISAHYYREAGIALLQGNMQAFTLHLQQAHHTVDPFAKGGVCGGTGAPKNADLNTYAQNVFSDVQQDLATPEIKHYWRKGVCAVKTCRTRPGKVDVGPCSICKNCEERFNNNEDPTKDDMPKHYEKTNPNRGVVWWAMMSKSQKSAA